MYKLKVNQQFDFEISEESLSKSDIIKNSENHYHLIKEHQSIEASIRSSSYLKKKYSVEVNSNLYEISIMDALDQQILDLGFEIGASKQVNEISAPMPGLILEINVKVGQEVQENDPLLILEAMKMENSIISPRQGIIKNISANQGETVNKSDILIEFE